MPHNVIEMFKWGNMVYKIEVIGGMKIEIVKSTLQTSSAMICFSESEKELRNLH